MTATKCTLYRSGHYLVDLIDFDLVKTDDFTANLLPLRKIRSNNIITRIVISDPSGTGTAAAKIDLLTEEGDVVLKADAYALTAGVYNAGTLATMEEMIAAVKPDETHYTITLGLKMGAAVAASGKIRVMIEYIMGVEFKSVKKV